MGYRTSLALHCRNIKYSETSQIVTFFTRSSGRMTAIAKGSRREKNEFDGPIDRFTHSEITWIPRPAGRLNILTGCDEKHPFLRLRTRLDRYLTASWVLLVLQRMVGREQPEEHLYEASLRAFHRLSEGLSPLKTRISFDLSALEALGKRPSFNRCVHCGESVTGEREYRFMAARGGTICESCFAKDPSSRTTNTSESGRRHMRYRAIQPSRGTLQILSRLAGENGQSETNLSIQNHQLREIRNVLDHCYRAHLGYEPELLEYLVAREEKSMTT